MSIVPSVLTQQSKTTQRNERQVDGDCAIGNGRGMARADLRLEACLEFDNELPFRGYPGRI
jgi:hypothetical protein